MEELQKLLERLGSQFAGQMQRYNELEFISLMNDLSIVFVVPTSYREYLPIFSWFYPHRMKELNSRLLEIVKHPLSFEAFSGGRTPESTQRCTMTMSLSRRSALFSIT